MFGMDHEVSPLTDWGEKESWEEEAGPEGCMVLLSWEADGGGLCHGCFQLSQVFIFNICS